MIEWLSRLTVYGWVDLGLQVVVIGLAIALVWDYERVFKRVNRLEAEVFGDDETPGLAQRLTDVEAELAKAKRSMQALARRINDDTGPIVLDRPTPAQTVAPTRPDLTRQRPQPTPRTGSTVVEPVPVAAGPRHRAKKKAS